MLTCRHCGQRIVPVNWYDGPGFMHDRGGRWCPPLTQAEPIEDAR